MFCCCYCLFLLHLSFKYPCQHFSFHVISFFYLSVLVFFYCTFLFSIYLLPFLMLLYFYFFSFFPWFSVFKPYLYYVPVLNASTRAPTLGEREIRTKNQDKQPDAWKTTSAYYSKPSRGMDVHRKKKNPYTRTHTNSRCSVKVPVQLKLAVPCNAKQIVEWNKLHIQVTWSNR